MTETTEHVEQQYVVAYHGGFTAGHRSIEAAIEAAQGKAGPEAVAGILYRVPVAPDIKLKMSGDNAPMVPNTEVVRRVPLGDGATSFFEARDNTDQAVIDEPVDDAPNTEGQEEPTPTPASPSIMSLF